jgi:hypothetical protein
MTVLTGLYCSVIKMLVYEWFFFRLLKLYLIHKQHTFKTVSKYCLNLMFRE